MLLENSKEPESVFGTQSISYDMNMNQLELSMKNSGGWVISHLTFEDCTWQLSQSL